MIKSGLGRRIFALFLIFVLVFSFSACASEKDDADFLKNLQKGLEARWNQSNKMDKKIYSSSADYRDDLLGCVNVELDKLGDFYDYSFTDSELKNFAEAYYKALELQASGSKYYGVDDLRYDELFMKGRDERAEVIYQLCEDYSFTVNKKYASTLADMTVTGEVYHEIKIAIQSIEESLKGLSIDRTGTDTYDFALTNTSNMNFDYAELVIKGYDEKGVSTASGSGYLNTWNAGTTVKDYIWMEGEVKTATAQVVVNYNYQEYASDPIEIKVIDDLVVTLKVPSTPKSISYTSGRTEYTRCDITDISYEVDDWYDKEASMSIYLSGKKTYDKSGNTYSRSCLIGWKLYDSSGSVVDSGTCYAGDCKVGEQFKKAEIYLYGITPGTYRLELLNVD